MMAGSTGLCVGLLVAIARESAKIGDSLSPAICVLGGVLVGVIVGMVIGAKIQRRDTEG